MPVYKLIDEMSYEELLGWFDYFDRRPIGWREDDRTAKLLQAQGVKEKPDKLFPSLTVIYKPAKAKLEEGMIDGQAFKQSSFFQQIMNAQGGDAVDL